MVVPDFSCPAVLNDTIYRLQLSDLLQSNKAVVLFFYPCDFTPIAAKDIELIQNNIQRLESLSTYPLGISPDTENVHLAYANQGLNSPPLFPLVADTTRSLSRHFNVMNQKTGLFYRAAFVIDKTRQVRFSFILEDDRITHSIDTICAVVSTLLFLLVP
ncbi:thioredoxin-like protein [Backusella circina FSU 941]|nr:thioredoxin-like protein [Backusella circina FSU 941]